MTDREKVIDAFERCFCSRTASCPGCYKEGPGFGYVCRQSLCVDVLVLLKEQADEIQNLRKENNSILTQFYEWAKEQKNDKIAVLEQKLKEQEDAYSKLAKEYLSLSNRAAHRPNVVRCKDCKHGTANDIGQIQCNMTIGDDDIHEQDWFCADGERR